MPFPPPGDAALQALAHVATMAASQSQVPIILVPQRDMAFCWGAAAVHPMQPLETQYQSIVHDAERLAVDQAERRAFESAAMAGFYFFEAESPRLLGVERDRAYRGHRFPLPADALRHARAELRAAEDMHAAGPSPLLATRIADARAAAWRVCQLFMPPGMPPFYAPPINAAIPLITGLALPGVALKNIGTALQLLDKAVQGNASVQMFYVIEPFYLSRLLVSYRVRSSNPVTDDEVLAASGALTGILNEQSWLADWLEHAMIDLELAVSEADPDNHTRFFLKGGRALAYLFGQPQNGRNDWDTQVLIDPNLPSGNWYALYRDVSNAILITLTRLKDEFYSLLWDNAAALAALPVPPPNPPDPLDPDVPEPPWANIDEAPQAPPAYEHGFTRACKAELIDVGMPRRDTIELREQWAQVQDDIIRPVAGIPIPGYPYYVDEYLMMIREFFAGDARAPGKTRKRIDRLAELLDRDEAAVVVVRALDSLPLTVWATAAPAITALVGQQPPPAQEPLRYALIVQLDQLALAYGMGDDPGLAQEFAAYFASYLPAQAALAAYPPNFRFTLPVSSEAMADSIGFAQWLSQGLQTHVAGRAALLAANRDAVEELLSTIYAMSIFGQGDPYDVQLAIGGSFAARLHADYMNVAAARLEPVSTVTLGLYCEGHIDANAMLDNVAAQVDTYLSHQTDPLFFAEQRTTGPLRIFWANGATIDPFGPYSPLVIEVIARPMRERPVLSYIWGLPVLGLRDLIVEYQMRAADIVEYARRKQLRDTAVALTEMLMTARD